MEYLLVALSAVPISIAYKLMPKLTHYLFLVSAYVLIEQYIKNPQGLHDEGVHNWIHTVVFVLSAVSVFLLLETKKGESLIKYLKK